MDRYKYDLHIHSALSPCAEKDMTPVTIVGQAVLNGLDFVAVADHNAIDNVEVAVKAGKEFGIKVVPAFELQTNEEIHILCLFERFEDLAAFHGAIKFSDRLNRKQIFGEQLIIDEDDNVIGEVDRMLLHNADISCESVPELIERYNGVAVPAHIDREMNGMLQILGAISGGYGTVEISANASQPFIDNWSALRNVIIDSDAHTLDKISAKGVIELEEYSVKALLRKLKTGRDSII